jgi:hypothetical protein
MTLDKRTVALGLTATAAVAAAVIVTVTNHKSGTSGPRKRVSDYVTQVNAVQNSMQAPLTRVMLAYKDFAGQRAVHHDPRPELEQATRTLNRLGRRLAAIPAPPEAAKLRGLILQLLSKETAITREVAGMATFTHPFTVLLARARAANGALGRALRAVAIPKPHSLKGTKAQVLAAQRDYRAQAGAAAGAQAAAVDRYDTTVDAIVRSLEKLRPPPAFTPGFRAQVESLKRVSAAGARLAAQLRKANRSDVAMLGRQFTLASRSAQSTAAQKAQIAAIRAYNARARDVAAAVGRVETELSRLQRTLP